MAGYRISGLLSLLIRGKGERHRRCPLASPELDCPLSYDPCAHARANVNDGKVGAHEGRARSAVTRGEWMFGHVAVGGLRPHRGEIRPPTHHAEVRHTVFFDDTVPPAPMGAGDKRAKPSMRRRSRLGEEEGRGGGSRRQGQAAGAVRMPTRDQRARAHLNKREPSAFVRTPSPSPAHRACVAPPPSPRSFASTSGSSRSRSPAARAPCR